MKKLHLEKRCPSCEMRQTYTQVGSFNRAVRNKTLCLSCIQQKLAGEDFKLNRKTGCWEWNRHLSKGGYGMKRIRGGGGLAHRVYYKMYKGKISDGLEIDHLCRNRKCVNPEHLEAVTKEINQRRGLKSRLKQAQVDKIRKIGSGMKQRDLAKRFNVSQRLIWNILHNKTWKI